MRVPPRLPPVQMAVPADRLRLIERDDKAVVLRRGALRRLVAVQHVDLPVAPLVAPQIQQLERAAALDVQHPLARHLDRVTREIAPDPAPPQLLRDRQRRAGAGEKVKHEVALVGRGRNDILQEAHGLLSSIRKVLGRTGLHDGCLPDSPNVVQVLFAKFLVYDVPCRVSRGHQTARRRVPDPLVSPPNLIHRNLLAVEFDACGFAVDVYGVVVVCVTVDVALEVVGIVPNNVVEERFGSEHFVKQDLHVVASVLVHVQPDSSVRSHQFLRKSQPFVHHREVRGQAASPSVPVSSLLEGVVLFAPRFVADADLVGEVLPGGEGRVYVDEVNFAGEGLEADGGVACDEGSEDVLVVAPDQAIGPVGAPRRRHVCVCVCVGTAWERRPSREARERLIVSAIWKGSGTRSMAAALPGQTSSTRAGSIIVGRSFRAGCDVGGIIAWGVGRGQVGE